MCLFQDKIVAKRAVQFSPFSAPRSRFPDSERLQFNGANNTGFSSPYMRSDVLFSGKDQCRACFDRFLPPDYVNSLEREMLDHGCIREGRESCRYT